MVMDKEERETTRKSIADRFRSVSRKRGSDGRKGSVAYYPKKYQLSAETKRAYKKRNGGRPKGSLNKKTVERNIQRIKEWAASK